MTSKEEDVWVQTADGLRSISVLSQLVEADTNNWESQRNMHADTIIDGKANSNITYWLFIRGLL